MNAYRCVQSVYKGIVLLALTNLSEVFLLAILGRQLQCFVHIAHAARCYNEFLQSMLPRALQDFFQISLMFSGATIDAPEHGIRKIGANICKLCILLNINHFGFVYIYLPMYFKAILKYFCADIKNALKMPEYR